MGVSTAASDSRRSTNLFEKAATAALADDLVDRCKHFVRHHDVRSGHDPL
jgi:hypothetical protein